MENQNKVGRSASVKSFFHGGVCGDYLSSEVSSDGGR